MGGREIVGLVEGGKILINAVLVAERSALLPHTTKRRQSSNSLPFSSLGPDESDWS